MDAADILDLLGQRARPLAGAALAEQFFGDRRPLKGVSSGQRVKV
jgi:hypothetical protein